MAKMFVQATVWPAFLETDQREARCAEFFAKINRRILADVAASPELLSGKSVVTFSHFLPERELHRGYRMLQHFEGSHALGRQLQTLYAAAGAHSSCTHVFGHTHFSIDVHLRGVRYVQQPIGNPHERRNGWQIRGSDSAPFRAVHSAPPAASPVSLLLPSLPNKNILISADETPIG